MNPFNIRLWGECIIKTKQKQVRKFHLFLTACHLIHCQRHRIVDKFVGAYLYQVLYNEVAFSFSTYFLILHYV